MSVAITIRNVPDEVRNVLAARAAASGRSMQEYLLAQLVHAATRPDKDELLVRHRARMNAEGWAAFTSDEVDAAVQANRDDRR